MTECDLAGSVSRETLGRLHDYAALLTKWNRSINLVAPSTLTDLWSRHIIDCAQLMQFAEPNIRSWVDLGSGGGLPGVVCAILAAEANPECSFTLVESDKRKAAFLAVCKAELGLRFRIESVRAEALQPLNADIVSARALAPLAGLLSFVVHHLDRNGTALLPKGKNYGAELEEAKASWQFSHVSHVSQTDSAARILALKDIKRV